MRKVKWTQPALDELAVIWMNAEPDVRKRVNEAAKNIDKELQDNPQEKGESRPGDHRIFVEMPLGVFFRIHATSADVEVFRAWLIRPRKKKA